jgi:hypothetical protein
MALAIVILGLIVFDLAALRLGYDSRGGKWEMPTAGDLPPKRSQLCAFRLGSEGK